MGSIGECVLCLTFINSLFFLPWVSSLSFAIHHSHITAVKADNNIYALTACLSVAFPSYLLTLSWADCAPWEDSGFGRKDTLYYHSINIQSCARPCQPCFSTWDPFPGFMGSFTQKMCTIRFFTRRNSITSWNPCTVTSPRACHCRQVFLLGATPPPGVNSFSDSSGRKSGPEKSLFSIIPAFHTPPR